MSTPFNSLGEHDLVSPSSRQAGFSMLLFQDAAAIAILALLPLLDAISANNDATSQANKAFEAIKIIAWIDGIIVGSRFLFRPLLRCIANSGTPEIFTAASRLLVMGIAALMQFIGLSMAFRGIRVMPSGCVAG